MTKFVVISVIALLALAILATIVIRRSERTSTTSIYRNPDPAIAAEADRIRAYDDLLTKGSSNMTEAQRAQIQQLGRGARATVAAWPTDSRFTRSREAFVARWELFAATTSASHAALGAAPASAERLRAIDAGIAWTRSAVTQADAEFEVGIRSRAERDSVRRNVAAQVARLEKLRADAAA